MKIHGTFTVLALVTALGAAAPAVRAAPPKGTQQQLRDLEEEIDKLKSVVVQLDRLLGSLSGELSAALGRIEELEMEPLPPEPVLGFASANGLVSTALSSWSTIPDMTVTLDVAGTSASAPRPGPPGKGVDA
jgi:hypothetical protein